MNVSQTDVCFFWMAQESVSPLRILLCGGGFLMRRTRTGVIVTGLLGSSADRETQGLLSDGRSSGSGVGLGEGLA